MSESTPERGSANVCTGPELKIRDILEKGGLDPYRMECLERTEDLIRLELIFHFREDMLRAEELMISGGIPLTLTSSEGPRKEQEGTAPLKYRFSMEGVTALLEINSIFRHALDAILSHLDHHPGISVSPQDREKVGRNILAELESVLGSARSSFGRTETGSKAPFRRSEKPLSYEEDLINPSEVMLYFQIHPSTLERWTSLAEENGMSLLIEPVDAGAGKEPPRGLVSLMETLRTLQIRDLLDLKEYISRKLERWEDLYEAFETARLSGLFPSQHLTPFEFALALLEARRN